MSNRVIKFRVWCSRFNKFISPEDVRINAATGESHGCKSGGNVDSWILDQFTGMNDKNGVEIYEGDIISLESGSCYDMADPNPFMRQIMWCDDIGGLTHFRVDGKPSGSGLTWCRDNAKNCFTVIGNIHENPELLEAQNND